MESNFTGALLQAAKEAKTEGRITVDQFDEVKRACSGEERPRALEYFLRHKLKHEKHAAMSDEGAGARAIDWAGLIGKFKDLMPLILQLISLFGKCILIMVSLLCLAASAYAQNRTSTFQFASRPSTPAERGMVYLTSKESDNIPFHWVVSTASVRVPPAIVSPNDFKWKVTPTSSNSFWVVQQGQPEVNNQQPANQSQQPARLSDEQRFRQQRQVEPQDSVNHRYTVPGPGPSESELDRRWAPAQTPAQAPKPIQKQYPQVQKSQYQSSPNIGACGLSYGQSQVVYSQSRRSGWFRGGRTSRGRIFGRIFGGCG